MGRWIDLSVLGLPELDKRLDELERGAAMKVVRPALRAGMKAVLPFVRAQVPVLTGALARSLKIRGLKRKKGRVGVQLRTGTREELGIPADSPWYYPAHVELGTEGVPGVPFLRAGLKAGQAGALQALTSTLWARLEKLAVGTDPGTDQEGGS